MNRFGEAIKEVGLTEAAKRIGESPQCVANWVARGSVPVNKCAIVEEALEGRVSKLDLRPHDWQQIWPDAAAANDAARQTIRTATPR